MCMSVVAHHKRLGHYVFNEFEVVPLKLFALGAGSFSFLVSIETEELGLIFKLALLQD